ncbi:MAG TPA: diacylglycerol kinase family protein [Chryseosolibacter sp.]|nr:diacylglycerol kinase family protein [Chryseosolibacter sp.]
MKVLFVVNPAAGRKDHEAIIQDLRDVIARHPVSVEFLYTDGKHDDTKIIRAIDKIKPDRVIAGGGDGTIGKVAKNLIDYKLPFGIVPLGSANGLATALEVPANPADALELALTTERVRRMDMLKFNDEHLCIHLADIGVNALIVKKYQSDTERGMIAYAKNLLGSIQESPLLRMIVRTPDGITTKEGYMMAFANAHKYGTGVHISEGSVSDGKFEICNVAKISLDEAIKAGLTILNVFIDRNMFSDVISCPEAEVEVDQDIHFQIDGEYMGMINHLKIQIVPGCVRLLK